MNESDKLERIKTLAAGFVIDNLDPDEEKELRQLLAKNPELVGEIDDLQQVLTLVLDEFTDVEVPSHLQTKIIEQAEAEFNRQPQVISQPRGRGFKLSWQTYTAAIAAVFVVLLGMDNYRLRYHMGILSAENNRLNQEFKQVQTVNSLLRESQTKLVTFQGKPEMEMANVSGSMLVNKKEQKALMILKDLPAPPEGKHYLLWAMVADDKLPCGEVKPDSWGNSLSELPFTSEMDRDFFNPQFTGLYVTLEDDANTSKPTGPIVMQSSQI
jgi:anti-sigma-K factor RskA